MKNVEWIGNLVSIILFSVLAVASWGLSEFIQRGMGGTQGPALSGPNAIVENAVIVRAPTRRAVPSIAWKQAASRMMSRLRKACLSSPGS
jgi:hypothetical protein